MATTRRILFLYPTTRFSNSDPSFESIEIQTLSPILGRQDLLSWRLMGYKQGVSRPTDVHLMYG